LIRARQVDRQDKSTNLHAAKTHLSRLVEAAAGGEEIIIAKAGKPIARLGPLGGTGRARILGTLAGKLHVPDNFDAPLPDAVLDALLRGGGACCRTVVEPALFYTVDRQLPVYLELVKRIGRG
jgi:prevent-host-death family protein